MSKKDDLLTPEERAKKYGNEIMGIGIFYLVLYCIISMFTISELFANPISLLFAVLQVAMMILMIIGGKKRNKTGVKAALAFEIYMIVSSIILIALLGSGPDLVALLVMIFLPFDIKGLSKAIKDMENRSDIQPQNSMNDYANPSIQNDYNNTNSYM